jgi:hypothetical protein
VWRQNRGRATYYHDSAERHNSFGRKAPNSIAETFSQRNTVLLTQFTQMGRDGPDCLKKTVICQTESRRVASVFCESSETGCFFRYLST